MSAPAVVPFVDLRGQHAAMEGQLRDAIERVIGSSQFVLGPEGEAFETEFAAYCGARHCVGVGSGSDALRLALLACGVGESDEVIVPAHTFVSTALAVSWVGATPVFVDVEPTTYTLDPARVEAALTPRTRAIVPVHLYGQCADMTPLAALAQDRGIRLIEDAAQAHGAEYRDARAGTLGDAACFSFYPTKNLGALGDGGAVVTNDDEIAELIHGLRDYGRVEKYRHTTLGYNSRLDEVQAAVLREKLTYLDTWNEARERAAAFYDEALAGSVATPTVGADRRHVYHLYVVRSPARDLLAARLTEGGVATQIHYPVPAHRQPVYRSLPHRALGLARTETLARELLSLPLFVGISASQLERVAELVRAR